MSDCSQLWQANSADIYYCKQPDLTMGVRKPADSDSKTQIDRQVAAAHTAGIVLKPGTNCTREH